MDAGHEELLPLIPHAMAGIGAEAGLGNQADFWNQVCVQYKTGKDIIADPFTAIAAIPAATSSMRNMSAVRFNVPDFTPEKCTGCAKCWTQCPDSAIPGVVSTVEEVLEAAVRTVATPDNPLSRFSQLIKNLGKEKAILFSTHILEEVTAACTRAVIVDQGIIVADGTPKELEAQGGGSLYDLFHKVTTFETPAA